MQHTTLAIAAFLTITIGMVHSWLGERRLIGPLLSPQRREGGYWQKVLSHGRFCDLPGTLQRLPGGGMEHSLQGWLFHR